MLSRWVRLSTGAKAHYMTSGETGPAVVLLHGGIIGSSGTAGWRFMAPFLGANGFRVYCPDLPALRPHRGPRGRLRVRRWRPRRLRARLRERGVPRQVPHLRQLDGLLEHGQLRDRAPGAHPQLRVIAGGIGDIVPMAEMMAADPATRRREAEHPCSSTALPSRCAAMMEAIIYRGGAISDDLIDDAHVGGEPSPRGVHEADADDDGRERPRRHAGPEQGSSHEHEGPLRQDDDPRHLPVRPPGRADLARGRLPPGGRLPNVQFFYPDESGHQGQTDQPDMFNQVFLEFFRDGKVSWETAQAAGISDRRAPNPDLVAVPAGVSA